jgi:hypothetical protein
LGARQFLGNEDHLQDGPLQAASVWLCGLRQTVCLGAEMAHQRAAEQGVPIWLFDTQPEGALTRLNPGYLHSCRTPAQAGLPRRGQRAAGAGPGRRLRPNRAGRG